MPEIFIRFLNLIFIQVKSLTLDPKVIILIFTITRLFLKLHQIY
jgi:hypothetical protein